MTSTEKTPQDAAQDEAEGVETVTFTVTFSDSDEPEEFTVPAFDELTADQLAAVEDYSDQPLSVRNARTLVRELLPYDQARDFGWTGATKADEILMTTAELFKAMAEDGWGLGKPSNRKERRSRRTTKR